jgi:phosphoesterase RecJ-like protein
MNKAAARRIALALRDARRILITAHQDPDGDSLGCQLAFHEYWTRQKRRRADILNHGGVPDKYAFMDRRGLVRDVGDKPAWPVWDAVVIFECSSLDRTGNVEPVIPGGVPIINIDHHQKNTRFGTVNVVDTGRAACGELVFDLLKFWRARITRTMAQQLAIALVTDTGRFRHPSTNARTLAIASELVRLGADLTDLTDRIYYQMAEPQFRLIHQVLANAQVRLDGTLCMLLLRQDDLARYGVPQRDTEGLVDYSLSIKTVRVGALLKELGPRLTKISLRSPDSIDVAKLARQFGGGGHKNAAGFKIELPIDEAAAFLEAQLR